MMAWLPWVGGGVLGAAGVIAALWFRIQLERSRRGELAAAHRAAISNADREALARELTAAQSAAAEGRARLEAQIEELHGDNKALSDDLAEAALRSPDVARIHRRSVYERAKAKTTRSGSHAALQEAPDPAVPGRGDRGHRG